MPLFTNNTIASYFVLLLTIYILNSEVKLIDFFEMDVTSLFNINIVIASWQIEILAYSLIILIRRKGEHHLM